MTPIQAANEYFRLEAINVSKAIAFAHSYEDTASAVDFAAYLEALDVIAQ
jgi:hypothetical protein